MALALPRQKESKKALSPKKQRQDDHDGKNRAAHADGTGPHSGWNNVKNAVMAKVCGADKADSGQRTNEHIRGTVKRYEAQKGGPKGAGCVSL